MVTHDWVSDSILLEDDYADERDYKP